MAKCNFCGICDITCPFGAINVTLNGQHALSIIEKESFPQLIRDIQVRPEKFNPTKYDWKSEPCPLNLINVQAFADGKSFENTTALEKRDLAHVQTKIDVDKDHCPCCRVCESKIPEGAIAVRKFMYGKMDIDASKCPDGCQDCLDVCPITGTLYLADNKVCVNEVTCVYCGACRNVCPVPEALELNRTKILHTSVKSGAWNKALERLASPVEISKELKAKGSQKAVETVGKLLCTRKGESK